MSAMIGDDLHDEIVDDVKVNHTYQDKSSEEMANGAKSLMRSLWSYTGQFFSGFQ